MADTAAPKLPLLISVPHAGTRIPPEVEPFCRLTARDVMMDIDGAAREIYRLEDVVEAFVISEVARAIVDLDRAEDDRGKDGVIKTHTRYGAAVYDPAPTDEVIEQLLEQYYRPYHRLLGRHGRSGRVKLGVDCHTMAEWGPPVGPDPRVERPPIVVTNLGTCSEFWFRTFEECIASSFPEFHVSVNFPNHGGYITLGHAGELPWVRLEISRVPFLTTGEKRDRLVHALTAWCTDV